MKDNKKVSLMLPTEVFGKAAVTKALRDLKFPISKEDVINKLGQIKVENSQGTRFQLAGIIRHCPPNIYENLSSLISVVCDSLDRHKKVDKASPQ